MSNNKPTGPTGDPFHDKAIAEIWEMFKESKARQAKIDAQLAKTSKEVAKLTRKLSKGEDQWGKIAESLVGGQLVKIMQKRFGIILDDVSLRTRGKFNKKQWEIDVIGVNGDVAVVVEVKTSLHTDDTTNFIRTIVKRFSKLMPRYRHCKIYAGVAYVRTSSNEDNVIKHAEDNGLFVIKVVGDTNKIVNSSNFKLRNHQCDTTN